MYEDTLHTLEIPRVGSSLQGWSDAHRAVIRTCPLTSVRPLDLLPGVQAFQCRTHHHVHYLVYVLPARADLEPDWQRTYRLLKGGMRAIKPCCPDLERCRETPGLVSGRVARLRRLATAGLISAGILLVLFRQALGLPTPLLDQVLDLLLWFFESRILG